MAKDSALSRQAILYSALKLADEERLEAVTMRRIAQLLGAGTMSLYYYVPSKSALHEGMVDLIFEQVERPPGEMQDWADRVVFVSLSFRRAALSHPAALPLVASGYINGPSVLQNTEVYLGAILQGGFTLEMAAQVYRAAASYIIGYLSLETGGYFDSVVESYRHGWFAENKAGGEYPLLSGIAPRLGQWNPECEFEAGLRRLLASFRSDIGAGFC